MKVKITLALLAFLTKAQDFETWPDCNTFVPCNSGTYLNKLACQCFSLMQCDIMCFEGMDILPTNGCDCVPLDQIKSLYPAWATEQDILTSVELGYAELFPMMPGPVILPPSFDLGEN